MGVQPCLGRILLKTVILYLYINPRNKQNPKLSNFEVMAPARKPAQKGNVHFIPHKRSTGTPAQAGSDDVEPSSELPASQDDRNTRIELDKMLKDMDGAVS